MGIRSWLARACLSEVGVLGGRVEQCERTLLEVADALSTLTERVTKFQARVGMRAVRATRTEQDDLTDMLRQVLKKNGSGDPFGDA